ncbi:MAG: galactonate dehydratase [Peptoniphilaceae bacterium]|nr:galactonate dehydratase [Peptoniphilaceae bacterium]MDY3737651.1 galactonate dehydratase [Peptoniphilaceae bacterium]
MKIKKIKIYEVKPRRIFVKLITDDGINGWGEMISGTKTETVVSGAYELGNKVLIDQDPFEIEKLWQQMHRSFFRGGPINGTIVSGFEMALWDIKGKALNVPVWQLLGGKAREKIKVYSRIGGDRPTDVVNQAEERVKKGFDSIKMNATEELHYIDSFKKIEEVSKRVSALRERFGYDLNIGIDFHGRVHKSMAKVLAKELEQYKPMFLEEVVLPENEDSFKTIANITSTPLATGERIYSRWGFKNIFKEGIIDIIQPDVALVGGINELKKIASTAESLDIAVAPHAPYGPIALAATLQVDVCTPNVFIQEQSLGIHYNKGFDLLDFVENKEIFQYDEGFVKIPQEPGLGVKLNEEMIDEVSKEKINRENPSWKNYDGTIAEW